MASSNQDTDGRPLKTEYEMEVKAIKGGNVLPRESSSHTIIKQEG